jgi:hypothetical protein
VQSKPGPLAGYPDRLLTLGTATTGEVEWCTQWASSLAIAMTIKNQTPKQGGASVERWLALVHTTLPENTGNLDPVSQFVQGRKAQAAVALKVFNVRNIIGCAHVIPEIATSCKTGDRSNERWIVTINIDLTTWNDVLN